MNPTREHISNLMQAMRANRPTSRRKEEQNSTIIENSRVYQKHSTYLEELRQKFPVYDAMIKKYIEQQSQIKVNQQSFEVVSNGVKKQLTSKSSQKVQSLKAIYENYTPIHEQQRQIILLIESMQAAANLGDNFVKAIFKEYHNRGGKRSQEEVEQKLQADLMFLIKRENQAYFREKIKYRS